MISKSFLRFIERMTKIPHLPFDKISEDERNGFCMVLVVSIVFEEKERFVKRIQTETGNWYVDEINQIEYLQWIAMAQVEMIKKAKAISSYNQDIDVNELIKKAQAQIEAEQAMKAISEEKQKLPEEDLIDEDQFRKMWGE